VSTEARLCGTGQQGMLQSSPPAGCGRVPTQVPDLDLAAAQGQRAPCRDSQAYPGDLLGPYQAPSSDPSSRDVTFEHQVASPSLDDPAYESRRPCQDARSSSGLLAFPFPDVQAFFVPLAYPCLDAQASFGQGAYPSLDVQASSVHQASPHQDGVASYPGA